jgi:hypothetical protein
MNIDGWIGNQLLNHLSEPAQYTCQRFPFFHRNRARLSIQNVVFVARTPFFSTGYPVPVGVANSKQATIRSSGKHSSGSNHRWVDAPTPMRDICEIELAG